MKKEVWSEEGIEQRGDGGELNMRYACQRTSDALLSME